MPPADRPACALLALADAACLDPARLAPLLHRLGLIAYGSVSADAAGELWQGQFGALPFRLTLGSAAAAVLAEARSFPGAPPAEIEHALTLEVAPTSAMDRVDGAQGLCALAALLAEATAAQAFCWLPAQLWSPIALLADAVTAFEDSGLPPVLHIVRFDSVDGGETAGVRTIASSGLGWLVGHELRLKCPSSYSHSDALRRISRLAVDAMVHRGLIGPMTVAGLDKRETLVIGPATEAEPWPSVAIECRPGPG